MPDTTRLNRDVRVLREVFADLVAVVAKTMKKQPPSISSSQLSLVMISPARPSLSRRSHRRPLAVSPSDPFEDPDFFTFLNPNVILYKN